MKESPGTVLITGGSSGIGRELARCFARAGHPLILTGRDPEALQGVAVELRKEHAADVTAWTAELGTEEGVSDFLARLEAAARPIEILVNNAGFGLHGNFLDHDLGADRSLTTVHLLAPWRLTKALLPAMVRRDRGAVLNVGSVYSFAPAPWQALYGAAKSWIVSFSLALREELRGTGVRVTALCPGTTLSRFRTRQGQTEKATWFTLTAEEVAVAGYRGLRRNRAVVVPGFYYKLFVFAARLLPPSCLGRYVYHTAYRLRKMPVPRRAEERSSG
jgi:short-subunit dehydrogenase